LRNLRRNKKRLLAIFSTVILFLIICSSACYADIKQQREQILIRLKNVREIKMPKVTAGKKLAGSEELKLSEDNNYWFLKSKEFEVVIEKSTGSIHHLKSLKPTPLDLLPPTSNGLIIYVWNKDKGWFSIADKLIKSEYLTSKEHCLRLELTLGLDKNYPQIGPVKLTYMLFPDKFTVTIKIEYLQDDPLQYEIGVAQILKEDGWKKQVFPHGRFKGLWSMNMFRYYDALNDTTKDQLGREPEKVLLPYGIIERADRYLLYGYLDLNSYCILAPNNLDYGYLPSFLISPRGIKKGEDYSFKIFYKVLTKPENTYTDIVRWYFRNTYSTNQLTKGLVTLPKETEHRTLPYGNIGQVPPSKYCLEPKYREDKFYELWEENSLKFHLMNALGGGGCSVVLVKELYPANDTTKGIPLKDAVDKMRQKGFKIYASFLRHPALCYNDKPPRKDWVAIGKNGKAIMHVKAFYHLDWADPDLIDWYVGYVKRVIEYYQFDGILWDMGWKSMAITKKHPEGGRHHGFLRIQYEIYKWLEEKYPDKYVIVNGSWGTPSQLYADAITFESGDVRTLKSPMVEAAKAFDMTLINLSHTIFFLRKYGKDKYQTKHIESLLRNLAYGATLGTNSMNMFNYNGKITELMKSWWGEIVGSAVYLSDLSDYLAFSAHTTSTPLVTESQALNMIPKKELIGSLWASKERLLCAVFNDGKKEQSVTLKIDKGIIEKYGQDLKGRIEFQVLNKAGLPAGNRGFGIVSGAKDKLLIEGRLGSLELLLMRIGSLSPVYNRQVKGD